VNVSKARKLLSEAAVARKRLQRHLLVAAALGEMLEHEPIVVGGTAEEFHSAALYHQTDLDLVGWVGTGEASLLEKLGFEKHGRHWFHLASKVAVEFPESRLDGDERRVHRRRVGSGSVAIIGVDDLYLDRVRQATANPMAGSIEYNSALAVGSAAYDRIDWRYVWGKIRATEASDPSLGRAMRVIDNRIRRAIRKSLG
jgi:hypothetical protein